MDKLTAVPEISEAIKVTFINLGEISPANPIAVGCGDDRPCAEESIDGLTARGLPLERPFVRIFGGKYGAANILLISAAAQHGIDTARQRLGTDYFEVADELAGRAAELGVVLMTHSARHAEGGAELDTSSDRPIACAKAAALGKINHIGTANPLAIRVAGTDSEAILGDAHDSDGFGRLPSAISEMNMVYFGTKPEEFAVSRRAVVESGTAAMVLEGDHAPSEKTQHVYNLMPDKVSDVNEAIARGLHYYDSDLTTMAEILLRAYPELDLDPATLLQAMILDATATRLALASGDGQADPRRIQAVRYGEADQALTYLSELK